MIRALNVPIAVSGRPKAWRLLTGNILAGIVLAAVVTGSPVSSAKAARLLLREVLEQCASRNLPVRVAYQGQLEAATAVLAANGRFAPVLLGGADTLGQSVDRQSLGTQLRYKMGVEKYFVSGTTMNLESNGAQVWNRPRGFNGAVRPPWVLDPFYTSEPAQSIFRVGLRQSLLRGAGIEVNAAPIRSAQATLQASRVTFEEELGRQLRAVRVDYWRWAAALQAVDIRKNSLALAKNQGRITAELIRKGRQARTDGLLARQIVAERRDALAVAISDAATLYERLYHRMGFGHEEIPRPAPDAELLGDQAALLEPLELLHRQAAENSYVLRRMDHERTALEARQLAADDASWPRLDAEARMEIFGDSDGLGQAYSDAFSGSGQAWVGGLVFSSPLWNDPADAEARSMRLRLSQHRLVREDAMRRTHLAVSVAHRNLKLAMDRIELAVQAKELSSEKLRAEEERYTIGRTTMQNLRLFQEDFDNASLRELNAGVSAVAARAELKFFLGDVPQELRRRAGGE